jgi:hypothetical protein
MIKEKSWIWWFTLFANPSVTTTISPHIYVAKGFYSFSKNVQNQLIKHEEVHLKQQQEKGVLLYLFLYIFCFPLFWNPYRYKWEMQAYEEDGTSSNKAKEYLSSGVYGWLLNK